MPDVSRATFRDAVAGLIALAVTMAISWSALWDGSQAAGTALVGALGAVTGWLFRSGQGMPPNGTGTGTGNGNGTPPPA